MSYRILPMSVFSIALIVAVTSSAVAAEEPVFEETVRVVATRLPDAGSSLDEMSTHVTVLDREDIERSGARTLQELLASVSGVVVYDQVGNDLEKTLDFRGFTRGSGIRVFLDGAPLNSTLNNSLNLELVALSSLERVEIHRGSSAAAVGGGSEAGVVHLLTRNVDGFQGKLGISAGSDDETTFAGEIFGKLGRVQLSLVGSRDQTDGFRQNAAGDLDRIAGSAALDLGKRGRLEWKLISSSSDLGNPGALTLEDFEAGTRDAPFNEPDFGKRDLDQLSMNYRAALGRNLSVAANLFVRNQLAEILSTGRSAPTIGGFFLDSDEDGAGTTVQLVHQVGQGGMSGNRITFGAEYLDATIDALAYFTPPSDPATIGADPDSINTTDRRTAALFVQNHWRPAGDWNLHAGVRFDDDQVEFVDALDPSNNGSRDYSELSLRAGVVWTPWDDKGLRLNYGEAFLPPTSEELFAFQGFGSNPGLRPEDSRSVEFGFRGRFRERFQLDAALFRIDTEDEIVYDPDAGPFGTNVNFGETLRQGLEAEFRADLSPALDLFAAATLTDSELRSGDNRGSEVPLVPRVRLSAGFDLELTPELRWRMKAVHVGDQVLDNDDSNEQIPLERYTVVDARITWSRQRANDRTWQMFAEVTNLFDETYATRGIFAFDSVEGFQRAFLTPAPGRRLRTGVSWSF